MSNHLLYPVLKTGRRPIDDVARDNPGIIYEPNHPEFITDSDWAAFHGTTQEGEEIYACITYMTVSARPIWALTLGVGKGGWPSFVVMHDEGTYTNALSRMQELLTKFEAKRGTPRLLN